MPDDFGEYDAVMEHEKLRRVREREAMAKWLHEVAQREAAKMQQERKDAHTVALDVVLSEEYD